MIPLTSDIRVGYMPEVGNYVAYAEYYGDGTIYGIRNVFLPDEATVMSGDGTKSVEELIALGCVIPEDICPSYGGHLVPIPITHAPVGEEVVAEKTDEVVAEKTDETITVKFKGVSVTCKTTSTQAIEVLINEEASTVEFKLV
jgi:hypothetical protein